MISPKSLLCFLPNPKANFLFFLVMTPYVFSCGSLGKLDLCKEVKPEPLQLAGVLETGIKPVDMALTHPLHFLWNIVLKSLCFGKVGELEKSKLAFSEPKKKNKNKVILRTKGHPILVKEEIHNPNPIWINNSE
jgi:hypothetical protein